MSQDGQGRSDRSRGYRDREGRTLPERIRHRRMAQGLRSYALARALDVSPSYVTMIERGKKVPSEDIAVAIATLLGDDPELYRAWVHSTRFTDPHSTLRGLQRLSYSKPQATDTHVPGSRLQIASERARRQRDNASLREKSERFTGMTEATAVWSTSARRSLSTDRTIPAPAPAIPLIALGSLTGTQVTFWRLPWALLDNDPRPVRFVIAPTPDPATLIVATPDQFLDIVMTDPRSDPVQSDAWRGWDDRATHGGAYSQTYDPRGKFGHLLRERQEFLGAVGDSVDVIVRDGAGVSIRRLSTAELEAELGSPM